MCRPIPAAVRKAQTRLGSASARRLVGRSSKPDVKLVRARGLVVEKDKEVENGVT